MAFSADVNAAAKVLFCCRGERGRGQEDLYCKAGDPIKTVLVLREEWELLSSNPTLEPRQQLSSKGRGEILNH